MPLTAIQCSLVNLDNLGEDVPMLTIVDGCPLPQMLAPRCAGRSGLAVSDGTLSVIWFGSFLVPFSPTSSGGGETSAHTGALKRI